MTDTTIAERHEVINDKEHHYIGKVEMERSVTRSLCRRRRVLRGPESRGRHG